MSLAGPSHSLPPAAVAAVAAVAAEVVAMVVVEAAIAELATWTIEHGL